MVSRFRRYWQIGDVLIKHGFGIFVQRLFPRLYRIRQCRSCPLEEVTTEYKRMRVAIEELGPTYVKLGQIMSTRQDILRPGLIEELKVLQDNTNPLPFEQIRAVIQEGCPGFMEVFAEIEEEPLASASIAQVHRARLKDGTLVALKVQRPGIEEIIETDISILFSLATRAERAFPEWKVYNPRGMIKDFANQVRKELDFIRDGKNADRLRQQMRGIEGVRVPRIYWEYSSRHILVMEYIDGVRVDHTEAIRSFGVSPKKIAERGFHAYMTQIFENGFFHGDPHPGNLLVTKEGDLVFLDFGIIGIIRPERRFWFVQLLQAMVTLDAGMILKALEGLGVRIPEDSREALRDEIFIALMESEGTAIGEYNFSGMTTAFTSILREYRIRVPQNLMLMLKVILMVMDVGITLDPGFDFQSRTEEFLKKFSRSESVLDQIRHRAGGSLLETMDGFLDLPRNINMMLKQFSSGTIRIDIVDTDIRRLQISLDKAASKILMGLVIAAVVLGSSLILRSSEFELPDLVTYFAVAAYLIAITIGLYTLWQILTSRLDGED